jgi:response regulator of citrate/malate metabolism
MTLEEYREYQQAQYAKQREANKAKIDAMFANHSRPLNNQYLLEKEEN